MAERHPAEFGVGTTVRDEDRDYELEEISFGDRDAGERGAEERKDPCRPGEPADKAFERLRGELGIEYGDPTHQRYWEDFMMRPMKTLEAMSEKAERRKRAEQAPPSLPDRGSGHAPDGAAQQNERGGPTR